MQLTLIIEHHHQLDLLLISLHQTISSPINYYRLSSVYCCYSVRSSSLSSIVLCVDYVSMVMQNIRINGQKLLSTISDAYNQIQSIFYHHQAVHQNHRPVYHQIRYDNIYIIIYKCDHF
jgi:hypothetical protein